MLPFSIVPTGKENNNALATANAQLRRTDVTCELIGSLAFGWIYSRTGLAYSITASTLIATLLVPLEIICVFWVRKHAGVSNLAALPDLLMLLL